MSLSSRGLPDDSREQLRPRRRGLPPKAASVAGGLGIKYLKKKQEEQLDLKCIPNGENVLPAVHSPLPPRRKSEYLKAVALEALNNPLFSSSQGRVTILPRKSSTVTSLALRYPDSERGELKGRAHFLTEGPDEKNENHTANHFRDLQTSTARAYEGKRAAFSRTPGAQMESPCEEDDVDEELGTPVHEIHQRTPRLSIPHLLSRMRNKR